MSHCDLHMHSTASDGTDRPQDLARLVRDAGLEAFALTDHDTAAGVPAAQQAAEAMGLAFVPGIELSADPYRLFKHVPEPEPAGAAVHILGYFIEPQAQVLVQAQQRLARARQQRNPQIVERLRELGVAVNYDEVVELADRAGGQVVGRPHIAQVLAQKGYVKSVHEAFARYLAAGAPAYVPKTLLSVEQAVELIHDAGGLAMLAHPVQLNVRHRQTLEHVLARLKDAGLDGVETRHPDHLPGQVAWFEQLAGRLGLLSTGGSDYHGSRKSTALGAANVPMAFYHQLCQAHAAEAGPGSSR